MSIIVERFGRNTLTIIDQLPGQSQVYGSMGADDADGLERFGRGRMFYSRQFGDLYKYNFVLNQLQKRRTKRVLYAGCGVDYVRRIMAENYCICDEYVGLDLHLPNLRKALNFTNAIAADYQCYDLSRGLGQFKDKYFDSVIALDIVEHMPEKKQGLYLVNELARVCSDLLIISTPQIQEGIVRYSDLHHYEFTVKDHDTFLNSFNFKESKKFGIHLGSKEYFEILKTDTTLRAIQSFTGSKLLRGLVAAAHPNKANDVLLCFSNTMSIDKEN